MKHLILINGTMGVGKTAVSRELCEILPNNVFLDGAWCWDSYPFVVTEETKSMVMKNIRYVLSNFLTCSVYDYVIFCWVMDTQEIMKDVCDLLPLDDCLVHRITLTCSENTLKDRLEKEILLGLRNADVFLRSVEKLRLYDQMDTEKINTDDLTVIQVAKAIEEKIHCVKK